jgi:hypothetical protein
MSTSWADRLISLVKNTPPPKGKYRRGLYRCLVEGGYTVTSRGGPDFFAFKKKDGRMLFLAVQTVRKKTHKLRRHQRAVLEALARYGVPCYRWNVDSEDFEEINFKPPAGVVPPGWREQWRREQSGR